MIANTPNPPYYAVIFSSIRTEVENGYSDMANKMFELAAHQKGYLGVEKASKEIGITISYWDSLEAIKNWKINAEHTIAREKGRSIWYQYFKVRICKVERDYSFEK